MPSDVLARVDSFYRKACELKERGHVLRAAENFGRAAEAAWPLGEDNLVALHLQLRKGNMLCVFATAPDSATADPGILAACRTEFITLAFCAVEALERRRMAGTLLEGKCAAAEEAWCAKLFQHSDPSMPTAEAVSWGALAGYDQFMRSAKNALEVLARAQYFAAECSAAQFQSFAEHAATAAELMEQPRRHGDDAMKVEAQFVDELRYAVAEAGTNGLDARLLLQLAGAWQRLQRSGVLQARSIDEGIAELALDLEAFHAAVQSSLTAPGLRTCALPGCGAREAHPTHFKSCAACRTVVYCCREHQVEGWPSHKKACKAARKAAAEDEAGPSGK